MPQPASMICRLALCVLSLVGASSHAQSGLPQPQVVRDMHTGPIEQIRSTADGQRLVSMGQDKTVRVWRLQDLALLRTIRLPGDPGVEGDLYGLALAPDGRSAFVGGWTGLSWNKTSQVYQVDLQTGRMLHVLGKFPGIIGPLALSADGRRLAVGLGDRLQVVDADSGALLHEDLEYSGQVAFVDFAPDGTLASTSTDGCLRLYKPSFQLSFRAAYPQHTAGGAACQGSDLGGVRFSPDGKRLAFGVKDRPEVVLMDSATLRMLRVITVDDRQQHSLCCISWTPKGETLSIYGQHAERSRTPLYRIADGGMGVVERFTPGEGTLTNSQGLADGGLVFATDRPELLRVDAQGRLLAAARASSGDFHFLGEGLRVSHDGHVLSFKLDPHGPPVRLSPLDAPDQALALLGEGRQAPELLPPRRDGVLRLQGTLGHYSYKNPDDLRVNGNVLQLEPFESVWSWASHPEQSLLAIGTAWAVRLVNAQAQPLWRHDFTSAALGVNINGDGRWVIAALADGTLRWLDIRSGEERMAAFVSLDATQWVAWRPDGFYASSAQGDEMLGWQLNRARQQAPDFYRAVQFERSLYRPDLLRLALADGAADKASPEMLSATLQKISAPRVTIESVQPGKAAGTLEIAFSAESTGAPITEVGLYVDGLPVLRSAERNVPAASSSRVLRTVVAQVTRGGARVRAEAEAANALGMDESAATAFPERQSPQRPGRLWLVSVGVESFDHLPAMRALPYATNDATEIARALSRGQGKVFTDVRSLVLTEKSGIPPTKGNVLQAIKQLEQMRPEDTLVVFLASHGTTDAGEYYFLTKDSVLVDVDKLLAIDERNARLQPGSAPSLLTGSELTAALRRLPGRRILMLDTCHAAAALSSDPFSLVKRSASAQLAVVSAAKGDEVSYDAPDQPHGVFTLALIQALQSRPDRQQAPTTLRNVFEASAANVESSLRQIRASARNQRRASAIQQTPVLSASQVLEETVLAE